MATHHNVLQIARDHGAISVRVFGSRARGEATSSSDLDLLVTLEPGRDLLDLIGLKQALEDRLGVNVDIVTETGLSPYMRDHILADVRPLRADESFSHR